MADALLAAQSKSARLDVDETHRRCADHGKRSSRFTCLRGLVVCVVTVLLLQYETIAATGRATLLSPAALTSQVLVKGKVKQPKEKKQKKKGSTGRSPMLGAMRAFANSIHNSPRRHSIDSSVGTPGVENVLVEPPAAKVNASSAESEITRGRLVRTTSGVVSEISPNVVDKKVSLPCAVPCDHCCVRENPYRGVA